MKSLSKILMPSLAIIFFFFTSCTQDEPVGKEEFGDNLAVIEIGPILNDLLNRQMEGDIPACSDEVPTFAQIMLTHELGSVDVVVPILADDSGLFTDYDEELAIPVPDGETTTEVSLTDFMVYAEEPGAEVMPIWVAPKEGSDYENFVNDPLPIVFDLRAGSKKYVPVEVLCFDDRDVNLYGYQFFDLIPKELYEFCVFVNYCTDNGRHYTGNYNLSIDYLMGDEVTNLYDGESPLTGNTEEDDSGDWYADPLCLAIPAPMYGEADTDIYLRVTVTLTAWDDNYGDPAGEYSEIIELSWNDVQAYFGDDDTIDFEHIFFNCGDDPTQDCPITEEDTDGDCVPNEDDVCPGYDDEDDMDGDGVPDGCDACPEDFGDPLDGGCPVQDCTGDADGDGINDCDDGCPYQAGPESNNGCPEQGGDYCETAYMEGDTELNTLANANRWGWAERYQTGIDGDSESFDIWAGAGQNDTSKGEHVGTAVISVDDDDITLVITLEPGVSLNELHVNLSEDAPSGNSVFAPGQYNLNDEVSPSTLTYTWDRDYSDDFYIIVHAVACY
ncbi:hypothetical protein [Salegentibacter salarius]|uniref:Uncharacterized protein n=1 Tax=Salegentibacter salarius TaxID=435906 RepID=A0A2N0U5B4_9FLAO|nr:hypothetical protein [Salegentibacter salarius]OEY73990.1 hypothetical protein BHS39_00765 [Salegentibacter salarius]PKD22190.1 hypothetical protein APR40_00765 [Salegentibacter salarius]SLJ86239.1 hypothetical protein SAMN05660445_00099 [Salegentibacter salarius]